MQSETDASTQEQAQRRHGVWKLWIAVMLRRQRGRSPTLVLPARAGSKRKERQSDLDDCVRPRPTTARSEGQGDGREGRAAPQSRTQASYRRVLLPWAWETGFGKQEMSAFGGGRVSWRAAHFLHTPKVQVYPHIKCQPPPSWLCAQGEMQAIELSSGHIRAGTCPRSRRLRSFFASFFCPRR